MKTDLRKEFNKFISKYGHEIIYIRRDTTLTCRCWNDKEKCGNPRCSICFGTGYKVEISVFKVRGRTLSSDEADFFKYDEFGSHTPSENVFFLGYNKNPKSEDIIVEVEWDGAKPVRIMSVNQIVLPDPKRAKEGRIEFWRAFVKNLSHDHKVFMNGIKSRGIRRSI
jgi:hypothetical protein